MALENIGRVDYTTFLNGSVITAGGPVLPDAGVSTQPIQVGASRIPIERVAGALPADPYADGRLAVSPAVVSHPAPPAAFSGLRTGPDLALEYEPNIAYPIDGSKALLRSLSPFMLTVEPPLPFGEDGGFVNRNMGIGRPAIDAYGAAGMATGSGGYGAARTALAQSGLMGLPAGSVGSPEGIIARNANGPRNNSRGDRGRTDARGRAEGHMGAPAIADILTAVDIAYQLAALMNTPPLVLLVNPSTIQITYTKVQQYTDRSRYGYIFHAWGEEQVRLSITAQCGAFLSAGRGVQWASRRDSASWQNLMNVFHLYKNNGYIYDTQGKSNAHHFVGALAIRYDGMVYYGNMETFTWNLDEKTQHGGVEFQMEFIANRVLDTTSSSFAVLPLRSPTPSPSDPRYSGRQSRSRNAPGEFTVNMGTEGITLSTQGRRVSGLDALSTLIPPGQGQGWSENPPGATDIGRTEGLPTQPVGGGFTPSSERFSLGARAVTQGAPGVGQPFGM